MYSASARTLRKAAAEPSASFEPLEPRQLLAGVTLIVHGYQPPGGGYPTWVEEMADAIDDRLQDSTGWSAARYHIALDGDDPASDRMRRKTGTTLSSTESGHAIVTVDWADLSNDFLNGGEHAQSSDIAARVLPFLIDDDTGTDLTEPLIEMPMHFIGHSRGASVVSELSRLLGRRGGVVDQVTLLDPHPLREGRDRLVNVNEQDVPVYVYQNVLFADNYWRTDWIIDTPFDFNGEAVEGAHNQKLRESVLDRGGYQFEHSDVHLWYQGTVVADLRDAAEGRKRPRKDWYGGGMPDRKTSGFNFSRVAGGVDDRPQNGLAGEASRVGVRPVTNFWPNVQRVALLDDDGLIDPNRSEHVAIEYNLYQGAGRVDLFVDDDLNPYNANRLWNSVGRLASRTVTGDGDWDAETTQVSIRARGIPEGEPVYIVARVQSGGKARYVYSLEPLVVGEPLESEVATGETPDGSLFVAMREGIDNIRVLWQGLEDRWLKLDLADVFRGSELLGQPVVWSNPIDERAYVAASSQTGLLVYSYAEADWWSGVNLTSLVSGAERLVGSITSFTGKGGASHIAGTTASGDIALYTLHPDRDGKTGRWSYRNLSRTDLRSQGQQTPRFTGQLTSYVTAWNGLNIVGRDANGKLQAVWTAPGTDRWSVADLGKITGAPAMNSDLTVFLTPWGGINIGGIDSRGEFNVTWWVPSFGPNWATNNLTAQFNAPPFPYGGATSYVTPWGGLNVVGINSRGDTVAYWWAPGMGSWSVSDLQQHVNDPVRFSTGLSAIGLRSGTTCIVAIDEHGSVNRYYWSPGTDWEAEDISAAAKLWQHDVGDQGDDGNNGGGGGDSQQNTDHLYLVDDWRVTVHNTCLGSIPADQMYFTFTLQEDSSWSGSIYAEGYGTFDNVQGQGVVWDWNNGRVTLADLSGSITAGNVDPRSDSFITTGLDLADPFHGWMEDLWDLVSDPELDARCGGLDGFLDSFELMWRRL